MHYTYSEYSISKNTSTPLAKSVWRHSTYYMYVLFSRMGTPKAYNARRQTKARAPALARGNPRNVWKCKQRHYAREAQGFSRA
jgi:hypothetical protein